MPESQIRLDIREAGLEDGYTVYFWVVQRTGPVEDLFYSGSTFSSRTGALADFQQVCKVLDWKNDITEVSVR